MNSVSDELSARSRKNFSVLLQKLATVGQVRVAQAIGVHEATVSRMKDGDFERIARMLAAMGLKIVPEEMELMDRKQVDAMLVLTRAHVNGITADALVIETN